MRNKFACVSDPNSFVTNPGNRYHVIFEPKINPDGTISLTEVGKEDIQAFIEEQRPTTDISYIVKKLQQGDTSVLNQSVPMFGDFTQMPKTYAESLQMVIDAERKFNALPVDVKNKFDNDYRQWFAQAGSDKWIENMKSLLPESSSVDEKLSEVVSNE